MSKSSSLMLALLEAQKEIKAAKKNAANPHFKSTYADLTEILDTVKGPLNKHGLVLTQHLTVRVPGGEGQAPFNELVTMITHAESGEQINSGVIVPAIANIQQLGGAITYLKRYSLAAMLALGTEDDDGNAAAGVGSAASKAKKTVSKTTPKKPETISF